MDIPLLLFLVLIIVAVAHIADSTLIGLVVGMLTYYAIKDVKISINNKDNFAFDITGKSVGPDITDKSIEYGLPSQTQFSTIEQAKFDKEWDQCPTCVSASKVLDNEYIENPEAAFAAELYRYESQPSAQDLRNADAPCVTSFERAFTTNERALDFGLDIAPDVYMSGDYLKADDGAMLKQIQVGMRNKQAIDGAITNNTTERFRALYEPELRENESREWWTMDNFA